MMQLGRITDDKFFARFKTVTLALVFVATFFCGLSARGQTARERQEKIHAAVEAHDDRAALAELSSLRSSEPDLFLLNNYDYLLARLAERSGDTATAAASYQALIARQSLLSQYALWHLSQFARASGNLVFEREQLRQLIATAPGSLLREAALARLGESFLESGDYAAAISALSPRAAARGNSSAREALTLVGQAQLRGLQTTQARETFNQLISQMPDASRPDDFALAAVRGLDQLDAGSAEAAQRSAPQLPESEHLRRALIYNFNRDFAGARRHYTAIVERYRQSGGVSDALYQIGRGHFQERRFEEAVNFFQRVTNDYPESASARDALSSIASSYLRLKRFDEAIAAYRRFIDKYTGGANPERPYLNIIDALRDAGREAEALEMAEQTRARFKGQVGAALALFAEARIHLGQGAYAPALADWDALLQESDLGGTRVPSGTNPTEVSYMRAYTLEQMGRTEDAINAYLELPYGRGEYYGWRASERLQALAANAQTQSAIASRLELLRADAEQSMANGQAERARSSAQKALRLTADNSTRARLLELSRRAYAQIPAYNKFPSFRLLPAGRQALATVGPRETTINPTHRALADELLFLGLYDEGTPELAVAERAFDESRTETQQSSAEGAGNQARAAAASPAGRAQAQTGSRDQSYTLAVFYKRGELASHAITFAEPIWKTMPADYLLELAPPEMVEMMYPAPYRASLLEYAPQRGVDPRFVLSIARQESRFRPEAKSISAARGLMQFIPSTADDIAAQLGRRDFAQDDLYNPRVAILFGSQYMGNLFKLFPEQPQAVAASYNGGEDNMERWMTRARSKEPDRYVLEIGFAQSKDYVYKVLSNFRVYQSLYSERLERR